MNVGKFSVGNYFKGKNLTKPLLLTIEDAKEEEVGIEKQRRLVLYFKEEEAGLCVNKTNLDFLVKNFGDESDNWIGKKIVLYFNPDIFFQGNQTGGLRLRLPQPKPAPKPVELPSEPASEEWRNEEAPF